MEYRWDDFSLDREDTLRTRNGRQVDVSRTALDCLTPLRRRCRRAFLKASDAFRRREVARRVAWRDTLG